MYSYAIYSAVFGEVKIRIAQQALIQEINEANRNVSKRAKSNSDAIFEVL